MNAASGSAPTLSRFQAGFANALFGHDRAMDTTVEFLARQPAFAVYRNTVMKGCVDALEANFPSVVRLVGSEWFRAAAAIHVAAQPPTDARLVMFGAGFPDFIARFEPARELPYLADVARLDRCWTEAHIAADAPATDGAFLATLASDAVAATVLTPHPAARWHWFDAQPIYTIWSRNRSASDESGDIPWHGEGALITRPESAVVWCAASHADCAFLDACANHEPLATAAAAALDVQADVDLAALLSRLLCAGAFQISNESTR